MNLYDIAAYGAMIGDATRVDGYRRALQRCIEPGSTVLDLGTGTGVMALIACRLGAQRVYAIEAGDAIGVARRLARDNGLDRRIEFIHDSAERVSLDEPVDVMVSDLRGVLPLFGRHIPSIIDARRRLVGPDGMLIPQRDDIWVAPVQADEQYAELVDPWDALAGQLDMSAARAMVTHSLHRKRVRKHQLVAAAERWATLDYTTIDEPDVAGRLEFTVERDATLHGFALWFDTDLFDGIRLSNAPGEPELVYGSIFMPLPEPTPVSAADRLSLDLRADLVGDDYVWRWDTELIDAAPPRRCSQSTFYGNPLGRRSLDLADLDHVPSLARDGELAAEILGMIDGRASLGELARRLADLHPDLFHDERQARDRVAALLRRYAR